VANVATGGKTLIGNEGYRMLAAFSVAEEKERRRK